MTRLALMLVPFGFALACDKHAPPAPEASGAAAAPAPSVAAGAAPNALTAGDAAGPSHSADPGSVPALRPACRAVRVVGQARVGEAPLASGELLDGEDWVTLEAGASVALKHSTSARELAIQGPAMFRACRKGREQVLLVRGSIVTTAGAGARPGAEVLIATPLAVVRYSDAELTLALDTKQLAVAVRTGQAELEPVAAKDAPKGPLRAKDKLSLPFGKPKPAELMERCQEAARAAEATARRVGDRSASEPLGERAQAHVRGRKAARAACTVAAAATGLVADASERAGLWAEVQRSEGLWESVPRPVREPTPEK